MVKHKRAVTVVQCRRLTHACCVRHPRSCVPYRERSELRLHRLRRRFRSECVEHGRRARRRLRVFIKRVVLRSRGSLIDFGDAFCAGDVVTVRLDLVANTVTFGRKNAGVSTPQKIPTGDEYYFVFEASCKGQAVEIITNEHV